MEDIFAVQDEISQAIADRLKVRVLGADEARFRKHYTENPEAYNLYLKGRWFAEKMSEDGLHKAIDYFRQAIAKDSGFALAFAAIADAYTSLGALGFMTREAVYEQATAEVRRALELDGTLAEAHLAMAGIKVWFDFDWTAGEREFLQALTLDPYSGDVHHQYAHLLVATGRTAEAVTHMRHALELEPVSVLTNSCAGQILYLARMYDEAIEQLRKTVEMDPGYLGSYTWLAMSCAQKGMYAEAAEAVIKRTAHPASGKSMKAALGYVHAVSGRRDEARQILAELKTLSETEPVAPYHIARIHAGLGEIDLALEWLRKCMERPDAARSLVKSDPVWDGIRGDPRFTEMLKKSGLTR